jgi:saccharopine dehydrogenase-like NADP-dependent oxidoreductase
MKQITVLGAGMVGRAMAIDLAKSYSVTAVDLSRKNLDLLKKEKNINTVETDLSDQKKIRQVIAGAELVIGAVPGFMGFQTVQTVIEAAKNVVDISFFPEDAFLLDKLAKEKGVTAIVDCGVAPGMGNIILGYHDGKMEVQNFIFQVGGLPFKRSLPFQYKAPFSPVDVIEIYTRPARIMENGKVVVKPALSDIEEIEIDQVGTLESFNSDGLRSLLRTMKHIPNMKEKTLRYPGHVKLMATLRDIGFFDERKIEVKNKKVSPLEVAGALLFPKWRYEKGEDEFTAMRVTIAGKEKGKKKTYRYDLFDRYNFATHTTSMARTTGYTCTAAATMVLEGLYRKKGIIPPEYLGKEEKHYQFVVDYLNERGVLYKQVVN